MSAPNSKSGLREASIYQLPTPPPWRRLRRKLRAHPTVDPLGQAVISLGLSLVLGGIGTLLLGDHRGPGTICLVLSAALVMIYLAIVVRAVKRDKAISYWRDRRDLRLSLTQERAHYAFLTMVLRQINGLAEAGNNSELSEEARLRIALAAVLTELYGALAVRHDDLAVVLAFAANRHYEVIHSALSPGSRWKALRPGKHCPIDRPLEDRLAELAEHHYSAEAYADEGRLCLIVLADREFDAGDRQLLDQLPTCLELLASRRGQSRLPRRPAMFSLG